jgi:phytol kinase
MSRIFLGYVIVFGYIFSVLLIAWGTGKCGILGKEGCRKLIHISLGGVWIILYHFLSGTIHLVLIPITFVLINFYTYIMSDKPGNRLTPLLSGMEREGAGRSPGTVYYALSVTILAVLSRNSYTWFLCCGIGLFCMTMGDGMAGVIGKRASGIFSRRLVGEKTIGGSMGCMIFGSMGCALILLWLGASFPVWKIILIGICCGILELPGQGLDNITVPVGCTLVARCLFSGIV